MRLAGGRAALCAAGCSLRCGDPDFADVGGRGFGRVRFRRGGRAGDGADWETLRTHTDDGALPDEGFATAGWAVEGGKGAFSQFRLLMTGPNSGGYNYLLCAGMELYGTLLPG